MDLSQFDLEQLQIFHITYQYELLTSENDLKEAMQASNGEANIIIINLQSKIERYKKYIQNIEFRINEINSLKLRFSVEDLFTSFGLRKSIQVHFLTTSNAYKEYGKCVTGMMIFEDSELKDLFHRIKNKEQNDGIIKFNDTVSSKISDEVRQKLATQGFRASEIDKIF